MLKVLSSILNLIYPTRCNFCRKVITSSSKYFLCEQCILKIKFINKNGCIKCGKMLMLGYDTICTDCRTIVHYFDRCYSVAEYKDTLKNALIQYKFYGQKRLSDTFVSLMLDKIEELKDIDLIIGIPIHQKRLEVRGFNQSDLLAKALADRIGVQFDNTSIIRVKQTESQSTLSRYKRLKNLKGAFKVMDDNKIINKQILLIDDIYTTGTTLSECAKVLKQSGAKRVYGLTVASGKGY